MSGQTGPEAEKTMRYGNGRKDTPGNAARSSQEVFGYAHKKDAHGLSKSAARKKAAENRKPTERPKRGPAKR